MTETSRFVSWAEIKSQIDSRISFTNAISGNPAATIYFDAKAQALGVTVIVDDDILPSVEPANMKIETKLRNGRRILTVQGASGAEGREFYSFLESFVDRVQNTSSHPSLVFNDAWATWSNILDLTGLLSEEKQRGLLGELIFLERISAAIGFAEAINSWHFGAFAEHDFGLSDRDLEVKTTTNEERIHKIGSVSQLQPSFGRPLYLGSVQLTTAQVHAKDSFSLPSKVAGIRKLAEATGCLTSLNERLEQRGYNDQHERHYGGVYGFRSPVAVIPVDENCPKITRNMLEKYLDEDNSRIVSVEYRINVSGLGRLYDVESFKNWLLS
jgi:hypothetical protein